MPRKRSEESLLSSSPCRKSLRLSSSVSRSEFESQQIHERSPSPQSSSSSSLSSPLDSEDLGDPFQTDTTKPEREALKRNFEKVDVPDYEAPVTRAATKHQTPEKKRRKVHFQEEPLNPKRRRSGAPKPKIVYLEGLDAPFKITRKSVFAKSDSSRKQKAWSRRYLSAQSSRKEAIENSKSALGPDLEGSRASTPASFVSNTPSKRGRGNGRRGRGRGGRGGRGRGGGRAGRNEDSPEPPKKKIMTEAEKEILADLKARQTELKKFFKEVGGRQNEALNLLSTRDLYKISKKSKAHERVPEYETLLDALKGRKEESEKFARGKYEYDMQQAKILLEAEKEVIEQRYKTRCIQAKSEHRAGARGDYLTAREGIQAMIDDNHTEPGSPDPLRFPQLHSFAKPGMVRGYYSQHITDETSLRRPPSSFDDAVRREVDDNNIISPTLFKALDLRPVNQGKDTSRNGHESSTASSPSVGNRVDPTLNIQALTDEAARRLQEPDPPPVTQNARPQPPLAPPLRQDPALGSWPLSRLADAAENESRRTQFTQNNHMFRSRMVPSNPFEHWLGLKHEREHQAQRQPQTMLPIQWPPQMQRVPISMPPAVPQSMPPSIGPSHVGSHPLPPPPPGHPHLQPSPQFMQRQQAPMQQYHFPQYQQPQHQHQPPQNPHAPPPPPKHRQPPHRPPYDNPRLQTTQIPHHQLQRQPKPRPQPVTFVHQTASTTSTSTTTPNPAQSAAPPKGRKGTFDRNNQYSNVNGPGSGSGIGGSSGAAGAAPLPPPPPPPPKGGQRLLLPKNG